LRGISSGHGDEAVADRVVEDAAEKVARAYRARAGSAILIRPDGHVAWRSPIADRPGLESWLDGVLGLKDAHPAPHGFAMPDVAPRPRVPGRPRDAAIDEIVLRAAFKLFLERGAEGATIDDIAKRTGIARAAIYRRWKSREDLLLAALRAQKQPPAGDPDAIAHMPLEDLIRHIQENLVEALLRPEVPTPVARLIGSQLAYPQLVRSYREQFVEPARQAVLRVITKGRESGSLRWTPDPELLRDRLGGAVIHRIVMRTAAPEEKRERQWVEALMSHIGLVTRQD